LRPFDTQKRSVYQDRLGTDVGKVETKEAFSLLRYPADPEQKKVFSGLNITLRHGQTAGICGQTGCGKSTLLRLLTRLYDVQEGVILLNGRDLRDYEPQWLRANIAFVTSVKDTYLFSTSVRENIEFGIGCGLDPDMPEQERIRLVRTPQPLPVLLPVLLLLLLLLLLLPSSFTLCPLRVPLGT
jgi:ABC-type bacteriocin/lantibiotic exporter with double-glycine peptidase domain